MSEQTRGGYPIVLTTTARNFYYLRTSRSIFFPEWRFNYHVFYTTKFTQKNAKLLQQLSFHIS